jgi:cyclin-dependent kinase regulatory subunit CKS1
MKKQFSTDLTTANSVRSQRGVPTTFHAPTQKPEYSDKYYDGSFEYRHVILPRQMVEQIKGKTILSEQEWRALGVTQSRGWQHHDIHKPEPHILIFRRPIGTDPKTGDVSEELKKQHFERLSRRT